MTIFGLFRFFFSFVLTLRWMKVQDVNLTWINTVNETSINCKFGSTTQADFQTPSCFSLLFLISAAQLIFLDPETTHKTPPSKNELWNRQLPKQSSSYSQIFLGGIFCWALLNVTQQCWTWRYAARDEIKHEYLFLFFCCCKNESSPLNIFASNS